MSSTLNTNDLCKLMEDYHPRLVKYAFYFTNDRDAAEDVVQDSFYNFLRRYSSCREPDFPRIMFKIVRNCCLDYLKHQKVISGRVPLDNPKGEMLYNFDFLNQESDGLCLYDELICQVDSILDKLPPRCREVFEMSRFRNMENKDIAEALGISLKTVKNHMTRALFEFRKGLGMVAFILFLSFFI